MSTTRVPVESTTVSKPSVIRRLEPSRTVAVHTVDPLSDTTRRVFLTISASCPPGSGTGDGIAVADVDVGSADVGVLRVGLAEGDAAVACVEVGFVDTVVLLVVDAEAEGDFEVVFRVDVVLADDDSEVSLSVAGPASFSSGSTLVVGSNTA